ncbi:glycosyltransferase family 1 protein [Flavobacterium sp.]|uniref:glycosyltransferase family 4 protein n=1 Tax=Flavobacterium sp. TaxID=239 RepID=UPI00286B0FF3|nr:glycosyltransferase family 1 protein [Flavobacterium sp.]
MKILLDNIIYDKCQNGGVSNYWFELSKFLLSKQDFNNELFFYEDYFKNINFHRKQLDIPTQNLITNNTSRFVLQARISEIKIDINDFFLFHSSYYRVLQTKVKHVEIATVHDFTHNFYASFLKRKLHNALKYKSIRNSNGIICISNNTYKDLKQFCPPSKNQKVVVIHNGVSDDFFQIQEVKQFHIDFLNTYHLQQGYLLYIGSRTSYKNFSFIISLLSETSNFRLVVVGESFNKSEISILNKKGLLQRIVLINNINNTGLNILYNFAHAFIYPSSYEGFGIPIIEAMKAGCPIMALKNSSITEIADNAGILFDKMEVQDFKNALTKLSFNDFRNDQIALGLDQSKKFSWTKCCEETYSFYKENYFI